MIRRKGLLIEDVEGAAGDGAVPQGPDQGHLVNDETARGINRKNPFGPCSIPLIPASYYRGSTRSKMWGLFLAPIPIRQHPGAGSDRGTVELKLQATVKTKPQNLCFPFPHRASHINAPTPPITY